MFLKTHHKVAQNIFNYLSHLNCYFQFKCPYLNNVNDLERKPGFLSSEMLISPILSLRHAFKYLSLVSLRQMCGSPEDREEGRKGGREEGWGFKTLWFQKNHVC